jgi:hypothetical protein
VLLLTEFVESILESDSAVLHRHSDLILDIDQLKGAEKIEEVDNESLVGLCLVMLKQLQPIITELKNHDKGATEEEHKMTGLESKQVFLMQKEDDNKLSFSKAPPRNNYEEDFYGSIPAAGRASQQTRVTIQSNRNDTNSVGSKMKSRTSEKHTIALGSLPT